MFTSLLIKEWKDKAVIALFGLIMMTAFTAAFVAVDGQDDLRELLAAGFPIIFFPAFGAILGAGAFESEFRDGAWAYLLSRPARKETVWLAKLAALLSVLAGYWLIFLGLTAAVPGLGGTVAGYRIPGMLDSEVNLFPLVLLTSLFLFSVAFSLSLLSEKLLGLVLGSIFLGSLVQAALTYVAFKLEGRGLLSKAGLYPWLDAYKLALVLSCLAFLAASLLTFRRADFSQPKRKAASLAKHSALFLIAAWGLAALWPTLRPGRPESFESEFEIIGDNVYFATTRGFYRYDSARDRLKKSARWRLSIGPMVIGGGKLLQTGWDRSDQAHLQVMNLDGTARAAIMGPGSVNDTAYWEPWSLALSPDGRRAAVISLAEERGTRVLRRDSLWILPTDGSVAKKRFRLDPALQKRADFHSSLRLVAWPPRPDSIVLLLTRREGLSALWSCDLETGTQRPLFEAARFGSLSVSPDGCSVLTAYRAGETGPFVAAVIDLISGNATEVAGLDEPPNVHSVFWDASWSAGSEDVAFLLRVRKGVYAPAVYFSNEGRTAVASGEAIEVSSSGMPSIAWAAGDTRLAVVLPKERALKILDRGFAEVGSFRIPDGVPDIFRVRSAGRTVLFQAFGPESVWGLDLETAKWKRIW
jgi:ABC-type transport system involved in multi-copper enzyme maturation permease subunit